MSKTSNINDYMKVLAVKGEDAADILLYGYIGQVDWWNYGEDADETITDVAFAQKMKELERDYKRINLRINSPGGSMYHGNAIITAIRTSTAEVHAYNDGMAASMAADIWLAAPNRHAASNSMLMIHSPSGICMGTAEEMREEAALLDKFQETAVAVMVESTGMSKEDVVSEFYDYKDHWFTAAECVEKGWVSEVEEYEAEGVPNDIEKMTYADMLKHFENKGDKASKGLLASLRDQWQKKFNRVKSAPTITNTNNDDMKVEEFNKDTGEKYTHEDFVKCLEEAGYTVTAPKAEKTVDEKIQDAVTAAVKGANDEIAALKKVVEDLKKEPAGGPTIPAAAKTEERFIGKSAEQIKAIKELEAEAEAELNA